MSYQIEFDQSGVPNSNSYGPEKPKMVQFMIDNSGGMIKDESQANIALIILFIIIVVVSVVIYSMGGDGSVPLTPPQAT